MATLAGFRLSSCHDWSRCVTRPMQTQLRCVSALARTQFGRNFLRWKTPLYRSFSSDDWQACAAAVAAHGHVERHSKYMAFVFEKPSCGLCGSVGSISGDKAGDVEQAGKGTFADVVQKTPTDRG